MKSKTTAILLCFFLGFLGIHRFYLGYTKIGIIQFLTGGGFFVWALVDFLRLITGSLGPEGSVWKEEAEKDEKGALLLLTVFIGIILILGGILIWPLFNLLAYLKALIFPSEIRKKYGSKISGQNSNFFDQEITTENKNEMVELNNEINSINKILSSETNTVNNSIQKLSIELSNLGNLTKNKDGSISQRSDAGKKWYQISERIRKGKNEIRSLESIAHSKIYSANNSIKDIKNKPWRAWKIWLTRHGRYLGNRDSLLFMLIGFPVFFFILSNFNLLELRFPTFENITEIYIYIVFVAPLSMSSSLFLGSQGVYVDIFKNDIFSLLISYDQALNLHNSYNKIMTLYNWVILTLPMPISTIVVYLFSKSLNTSKGKNIEPKFHE